MSFRSREIYQAKGRYLWGWKGAVEKDSFTIRPRKFRTGMDVSEMRVCRTVSADFETCGRNPDLRSLATFDAPQRRSPFPEVQGSILRFWRFHIPFTA